MKRLFTGLMLVMLLSFGIAPTVSAEYSAQVAGCPKPFHLHHLDDHDTDHEGSHRHIGSHIDRNGDEYICVKHLPGDKHLHIDNNVPSK